jgi:hypothetical protein
MVNYPSHTRILLDNLFLPIPYPITMGMGMDTGDGYSAAGLFTGPPREFEGDLTQRRCQALELLPTNIKGWQQSTGHRG